MKVTGFASLFLQFIQQRALASRCPAVSSALLDCGKQSLWPLSAYKAVPLNISFSPWIINCLALGVLSATGEYRAEGLRGTKEVWGESQNVQLVPTDLREKFLAWVFGLFMS